MSQQHPFLLLASAAALSLALGQAMAEEHTAPADQPAPEAAATESTSTQAPAETAETQAPPAEAEAPAAAATAPSAPAPSAPAPSAMEKQYEEATAERHARYQDLRKRAAEVGMELPETPPWERDLPMQRGMMPPMHPGMRGPRMMAPGTGAEQTGAEAPGQMPQPMTPEERMAMREKRWEAVRQRAAEQGMELPETPPWEAAEQRRKEMLERYNDYRSVIEAMSDEQKEAIAALFGGGMQRGSGCGPRGGYGGRPGYGRGPGGWSQPQMPAMPGMPSAPSESTGTGSSEAPASPAPTEN